MDYDRDGFLDIYVAQYPKFDPSTVCTDPAGRRVFCGPHTFARRHDVLLHNNGDGTFSDVSQKAGIARASGAGLGVVCADLDGDGWIDIYVANDFDANQLWINQRDGTFADQAVLAGAAYNALGMVEASMGLIAADFDLDSDLDLFMTHLAQESNTLYRNLGPFSGYDDFTASAGLAASSMSFTGFGTVAFDADLDGDEDIALVNGRITVGALLPGATGKPPWSLHAEPNLFYLNDGTGKFELRQDVGGDFCTPVEVSRGLACGDVDNDGDVDLLVNSIQGPARLYRNDAPADRHWLRVRAVDPRWNRDAIGATITVECGSNRWVRTLSGGFSYLSASDHRAFFGLDRATKVDRVRVAWPDGHRELFSVSGLDQEVTFTRGTGTPMP